MIVNPLNIFFTSSAITEASGSAKLSSNIFDIDSGKRKKKTALNIAGSFEHTQCADANGYVQDDAVFEFLTKDDF